MQRILNLIPFNHSYLIVITSAFPSILSWLLNINDQISILTLVYFLLFQNQVYNCTVLDLLHYTLLRILNIIPFNHSYFVIITLALPTIFSLLLNINYQIFILTLLYLWIHVEKYPAPPLWVLWLQFTYKTIPVSITVTAVILPMHWNSVCFSKKKGKVTSEVLEVLYTTCSTILFFSFICRPQNASAL